MIEGKSKDLLDSSKKEENNNKSEDFLKYSEGNENFTKYSEESSIKLQMKNLVNELIQYNEENNDISP